MKTLPLTLLFGFCLFLPALFAQEQKPQQPAPAPAAEEKPADAPTPPPSRPAPPAPPKPAPTPAPGKATVATSIGADGSGKIVVEARGELPKPPVFFTSDIDSKVTIGAERLEHDVTIKVHVLQGEAATVSFHTRGIDPITSVEGKTLQAWSLRWENTKRFLDIQLKPGQKAGSDHEFKVKMRSEKLKLPASVQVTNFAPGKGSTSMNQVVALNYATGVVGRVTSAKSFLPVDSPEGQQPHRFQTSVGGVLTVQLSRSSTLPDPVTMSNVQLKGTVHPDGRSASFSLIGTAKVSEAGAKITVLEGNAAISDLPASKDFTLKLIKQNKNPAYQLTFPAVGEFPVALDFVAGVTKAANESTALNFTVAGGAVVPLSLSGLGDKVEFLRNSDTIAPQKSADDDKAPWIGFVPATGRVLAQWKSSRKVGEGRLFFSTTGRIETAVGAGLLRQQHLIDYQVLQGELPELNMTIDGSGEVLSVEGQNIVAWTVVDTGGGRRLEVRLSQPVTESAELLVRTQTPLDALPVKLNPLRLTPVGAVRHSGHLRLTNRGSVRLEPANLTGLTQLAPDQYPAEPVQARQVFVYRFPAADYGLDISADRIQPEVTVSELTLYRLAKTDRMISSDIELDIREAPIREWDIGVPEDYSVVSVVGAAVSDYVAGSDVTNGTRLLKVLFSDEVSGRQLITVHLEKNEAAAAGDWSLPRLSFADAKSQRGDIGIVGEAGFRIAASATELLVEKPLSYFPKSMPGLQQAFRIRESGWTATMRIEVLEKSVQADVFHLYSLSDNAAHGSVLLNYLVTGAPVSEWRINVPEDVDNIGIEGRIVRTWRREGDVLVVSLQQPVIGVYQLLVTFEKELSVDGNGRLQLGRVAPAEVQGERGYLQIVSPVQVEIETTEESPGLLKLDALELPAEFRLIASAPPLGSWQYTERPFALEVQVSWFEPGATVQQVVDFSEITSQITADGDFVSKALYYVRSRGQRALRLRLPDDTRLWGASVSGRPVSVRQDEDSILIPLPGASDPNLPIEVRMSFGKEAVNGSRPLLALPILAAPALKTDWRIVGDEGHALLPLGGTVTTPETALPPSGFAWLSRNAIGTLALVLALLVVGLWLCRRTALKTHPDGPRRTSWRFTLGLTALLVSVVVAIVAANGYYPMPAVSQASNTLRLSLPALGAGENVELKLRTIAQWQIGISWFGVVLGVLGVVALVMSFKQTLPRDRGIYRSACVLLFVLAILTQGASGKIFLYVVAAAILVLFLAPRVLPWLRDVRQSMRFRGAKWRQRRAEKKLAKTAPTPPKNDGGGDSDATPSPSPAPTALLAIAGWLTFMLGSVSTAQAQSGLVDGFATAESSIQQWQIEHSEKRLTGSVAMQVSGKSGDRFVLLSAPAVLTSFEGEGLRLNKQTVPGVGLAYIATIAAGDPADKGEFHGKLSFKFESAIEDIVKGFPLPTGSAALQKITAEIDQPNWEFLCPAAVKIESGKPAQEAASSASLLLAAGRQAVISARPKPRDVSSEKTQFFVEGTHLYLPGPGVVDGRHRFQIRPSQGQVESLSVLVPEGLTVSEVQGPIASWQFDADQRRLELAIGPPQSAAFAVLVGTQRGLDPLPADLSLAPLRVSDAAGEVGLIALAFGADAQPEKADSDSLSPVNPGDFDASMLQGSQAVLHRVFRYGADGGEVAVRVAPVDPEIRVASKQVLSFGDERVVPGVNFAADITRAGLFQLSFPLPGGFEVESLTGAALHHWAELAGDDGQRQIVLHLNGKTIGNQTFALSLSAAAPSEVDEWAVPRFELNEANRQTGDLVVQATTGIRLRSVTRQNVSEIDPRSLGGNTQGALAFRLLQRDWSLILGVEQLDPWITTQVLHEVTLREGQTRSAVVADLNVRNASVRSVRVQLPLSDADEIRTLRASGSAVSDLVRTAPDSNVWELQFKRRVIGSVQVRIEYDRRDSRDGGEELLTWVAFPDARQGTYHLAVRAGGRLELSVADLPRGWQLADWTAVAQSLRDAGTRNAPNLTLRAVAPEQALLVQVRRHALADALKLRVANGALTTVLSPLGDQVTSVDLLAEVIQPGSLNVKLPEGGELFSIFVNDESVHSIRQDTDWRFHVLPGADERHARIRFVYSVPGDGLRSLALTSPQMNVPLENIDWHVVAPSGFELTGDDGDLQLNALDTMDLFDRRSYLSKAQQQRSAQAQQAAQLLERASQYRQAGEQGRALWALNSVVNQHALDAASNEDARVQLENLQTQQAVVGLNTRRQRLYLDSSVDDDAAEAASAASEQLKQGAAANPVLLEGALNFRPQDFSQLLQGNTSEDNEMLHRIAVRMVQQQRSAEPAPQAITVTLPDEGNVYSFSRTVQVADNAPLELKLRFAANKDLGFWRVSALLLLLAALAIAIAAGIKGRRTAVTSG